jgi:hypothetical protein
MGSRGGRSEGTEVDDAVAAPFVERVGEVRLVDLTVVSSNLFLDWIREADTLRRTAG